MLPLRVRFASFCGRDRRPSEQIFGYAASYRSIRPAFLSSFVSMKPLSSKSYFLKTSWWIARLKRDTETTIETLRLLSIEEDERTPSFRRVFGRKESAVACSMS